MSIADVIHLLIPVSLGAIVLSLGMRCTFAEATFLVREPGLLLRSVFAMNVLFPLCVVLVALLVDISAPVKVALIALAVAPVPPILPAKQLKLVTRESYVYGLLVTTSILSIVLIPLTLSMLGNALDRDLHVNAGIVAKSVAFSVLVPLAVGMLVRQLWPQYAEGASRIVGIIGNILLLVAFLPILVMGWPALVSLLGDGTLLVCIGLTLLGLLIGHVLGGPNADDRSVLALAVPTRHPGIAIAIAAALYPGQKLVAVAVILYLLVSVLASTPYNFWRKRRHQRVIGVDTHDHGTPLHR